MNSLKEQFLTQLKDVLSSFEEIRQNTEYDDFSDVSYDTYGDFKTSALAVIDRIAGPDSIYAKQANNLLEGNSYGLNMKHIPVLAGIVRALRDDVKRGFLEKARVFIHGELFSDFLEMSDFLLDEGYKDAAAVMGGGVLETHLHQLCMKHNIDLEEEVKGRLQRKTADRLNNDLMSKNVYSKLDQKNVTSWLDLRNKAAHAEYIKYTAQQVALFLQSIRDFITRYPA